MNTTKNVNFNGFIVENVRQMQISGVSVYSRIRRRRTCYGRKYICSYIGTFGEYLIKYGVVSFSQYTKPYDNYRGRLPSTSYLK